MYDQVARNVSILEREPNALVEDRGLHSRYCPRGLRSRLGAGAVADSIASGGVPLSRTASLISTSSPMTITASFNPTIAGECGGVP